MGAEQSSSARHGDGETTSGAVRKTCYYEVLGLERQASDDDIKKAYRRKALELHPDRNYGNVEAATQQFAEVQSAYQVLSDPQERAWYDSHREQILGGDDLNGEDHFEHNVKVTTAGELISLIGKFSPNIPFTDAPNGFFGILNIKFENLSKEEDAACDWEGLDPIDWPEFGGKDDDYNEVVKPFYAMWSGFATKKTFSWKDQYNYAEAPDRRVRRLMEKENKRLRDDAIREFNEAVRSLVSFVRKRDPRYIPNTQTEADRQKVLRDAAAAQAARSRAAHQAKIDEHVIPDWAKTPTQEEQTGEFSDSELSDEEQFECVVCGKTFKSEKQYEAHEKSKKHVKAVQQLKRQMQKENKHLNLDGQGNGLDTPDPKTEGEEEVAEIEVEDEDRETKSSGEDAGVDGDSDKESSNTKDQSPAKAETQPKVTREESSESELDDEYAPREAVESRLVNGTIEELAAATATTSLQTHDNDNDNDNDNDSSSTPKLGKAKAKRAKKAAKQEAAAGGSQKCGVCNEEFPSKTKLFAHLKDEGHAAPIGQASSGGGAKKGGKRK